MAEEGESLPASNISQEPVKVLFDSQPVISKRDVWEIDLIQILDMLVKILEQSGKKDLKVAGMAALSSSIIYKMKVESISDLHSAAMRPRPMPRQRTDVDIEMIDIPYRHESTYPVSLDDLLGILENLISNLADPSARRRRRDLDIDAVDLPVFEDYLLNLESEIDAYRVRILETVSSTGRVILQDITESLNSLDAVKCFFAALFLARDRMVDLKQEGDDILILVVAGPVTEDES